MNPLQEMYAPEANVEVAGIAFSVEHDIDEDGRGITTVICRACTGLDLDGAIEQRAGNGTTDDMTDHADLHVDCFGCEAQPLTAVAVMRRLYDDGAPAGSNPLVPFCSTDCHENAVERGGMAASS